MNQKTKNLVLVALLSAIAFVLVALIQIPVVMFLSYEPKDVIITISGFIFGPMMSVMISTIVSILEMITISTTGPIGLIMNILSTVSFALPAAILYKKNRSIKSAVLGLLIGTVLMTTVMILWNLLITPFYLGVSRSEVIPMLLPIFLPFNILKGSINMVLILLIYKPLVKALVGAKLISHKSSEKQNKNVLYLTIALLLVTILLIVLMFTGQI